jgi:hypothetical protein
MIFSGGLGFSVGFGFAAASERKNKSIFAKITTKTWQKNSGIFVTVKIEVGCICTVERLN